MSEIRRCNRTVYEGHVKYSRSYLVHMCYMKKADGRTCLWPPEGSVVLHHAHLQEGSLCLWTPSRAAVFVLCAFSSLRWDWSSIHGRISWLIFQSCILDFFSDIQDFGSFQASLICSWIRSERDSLRLVSVTAGVCDHRGPLTAALCCVHSLNPN